MTDTPHPGITPDDIGTVPDFDIAERNTASVAHDIKQPLAPAIGNAQAASPSLRVKPSNMDEMHASGSLASDVVDRVGYLIRKQPPRKDSLDLNETIRDAIALILEEVLNDGISLDTQLMDDLPAIFDNRASLVAAEIARLDGRDIEAMRLYEQAIPSARANRFVDHEAIAYKVAARFHVARGFDKIAVAYFPECRHGYLRWSTEGKVRQHDQQYPQLRQERLVSSPTSMVAAPVERVTVLKVLASQEAISLENTRLYRDLEDREARIRRLVDSNIIGIFIWDLEGRIIEANDAFLHMVGCDRGDLVSDRVRWIDLTPAEWRERDERALVELSSTGTVQPYEKEYFRKDGSRVPVLIGGALFEEGGSEGVAFVLDLTERNRAEKALRESEAKFRDYAETASDWLWEIGPDYKFTLLTENAFGSDPAGRIGAACWDHALDRETEPEKWRLVWATLESHKPFRDFVYCCVGRNGSPMYVKASGKPVFDTNGEFRGYRGTGTNVTAVMRAQQAEESLRTVQAELAHVSRVTTLGQLTASIAHEITQPIASARNNARAALNFLDQQPPDLGEVREALGCVVGDADRAGDIVDRIRDHIKRAPPRKDRVDLNEAINEVIVFARGAITENGVSVQTRLAEGLFPVQGDRVQLQQVVLNLILNAAEAIGSVEAGPQELFISTEQDQTNGVLVAVRDSGPGIYPEHLERVFEAFYTTKSSGVGMGLSICRSIIEAHGGRLWADANKPRGAVFQFTLPIAKNEVMNPPQAAHRNGEPRQDDVSHASHQLACQGNKRLHSSEREAGRLHRGKPSRGLSESRVQLR